jgi:hypothetical protein
MLLEYAKTAGGMQEVDQTHGLPTQEYPITTATALSASDTVTGTAGRYLVINCTVAGNVKIGFAGGSTITIAVAVGTLILPWAANQVFVTGTTATATYAIMS